MYKHAFYYYYYYEENFQQIHDVNMHSCSFCQLLTTKSHETKAHERSLIFVQTFIQSGSLLNVPVVKTSTAVGNEKFGSLRDDGLHASLIQEEQEIKQTLTSREGLKGGNLLAGEP